MEHLDGMTVSASTYNNYGCRCDECREAWADYMRPRLRAYRAKKRQQKKLTKGVNVNI